MKKPAHSGLHLMANLSGVDTALSVMIDMAACKAMCLQLVDAHQLHKVGDCFHGFGQQSGAGGVTGVVILAESHLAIHTWPEAAYVTLDVFVCNFAQDNEQKARALCDALIAQFAPASVNRYEMFRD